MRWRFAKALRYAYRIPRVNISLVKPRSVVRTTTFDTPGLNVASGVGARVGAGVGGVGFGVGGGVGLGVGAGVWGDGAFVGLRVG